MGGRELRRVEYLPVGGVATHEAGTIPGGETYLLHGPLSTPGRRQSEFDPGHTDLDEVYGRGRGLREADDPARLKRTTVIDADHYARAGIEPGYFYHGIEGECLMGGRELRRVEYLPVGGVATHEAGTIPGGETYLLHGCLGLGQA